MASRADAGPRAGIHDVAERAGVSTATVSRALRGLDRVSPATRERVLQAAEELHYTASPSAASLVTGKTGVVAVLAPFVSRWFFAHVLDGVERALRANGLHVLLLTVGEGAAGRQVLHDRRLLHRRVDGLLVLSCDLRPDEVADLQALSVPVVTVGVDVGHWDLVGIDDGRAGDVGMTHLLDLGHRRVAYVGGDAVHDLHVATTVERDAGVRRALRRARVPVRALRTVVGDWSIDGGVRAGEELLRGPERPTGVLAASDEMAVGVVLAARRAGLRVPQDLSVVGVDDHEFACTHELTTVRQPVDELGTRAATMLVEAVRGGVPRARRVERLPIELVVRGSTAPPPPGSTSLPGPRTTVVRAAAQRGASSARASRSAVATSGERA